MPSLGGWPWQDQVCKERKQLPTPCLELNPRCQLGSQREYLPGSSAAKGPHMPHSVCLTLTTAPEGQALRVLFYRPGS